MWQRIRTGRTADLQTVLAKWTKEQAKGIWNPPKRDQAFQQVCACSMRLGCLCVMPLLLCS